MSKEQFDIECKKQELQKSGDSFVLSSHKITLGAHWFADRKVAVFLDDRGLMIYSNYSIETPEQLRDALKEAKKEMDDALSKIDRYSYERLDFIPAEGIRLQDASKHE